ncbi:competence protein CoiA [Caballeronia sp. BR00000012568055]|uniref:competence protein CoiA n=1 Tax=Caballeronia sp. BR00000012568055 TaxID=2918761 RepID=UPI0023F77A8C|nr:competence protein CoiA family protein [Caballeronia sp. BR00000012568055]
MLTASRKIDGQKLYAFQADKIDAPFACPTCDTEVVLRKGHIKVHHFAHKPPVTCYRGQGETVEHMRCKLDVFNALSRAAGVQSVELEKDFGGSVADVFARIRGVPVAIEVQRSKLSVSEITRRTLAYNRLGVYVLWIALPRADLRTKRISANAWEKWCHAAYYGNVYYWRDGATFEAFHLGDHFIHVPSSSWFEAGGYEQPAGGYDRRSKRWRTPQLRGAFDLATDFVPKTRGPYSKGSVHVPACRIYTMP